MTNAPRCPICGERNAAEELAFPDNPWLPGSVLHCSGCGIRFKAPVGGEAAVAGLYVRDDLATHEYWTHEDEALPAFRQIATALEKRISGRGGRLLDVGCGPGTFIQLAESAGFEVIGVDMNPTLAKRAEAATNARIVVGDIMDVDLGGERFDVVTLLDFIEHVLDPIAVLARCRDLLAPRGTLLVYTPNHHSLIVRLAQLLGRISFGRVRRPLDEIFDGPHVVFFDKSTLRRALVSAGFRVDDTLMMKYEPQRSQQAAGITAMAVRAIEFVSPLVGGQFRILMAGVPA